MDDDIEAVSDLLRLFLAIKGVRHSIKSGVYPCQTVHEAILLLYTLPPIDGNHPKTFKNFNDALAVA